MTTWQPDYQRRDHEVVDYESWTPDGVEISLRGPAPDLTSDFFTCIGSAHTFGCFVARPYPVVLAELLGVPALNLGLGSAGPQFFSARPELVALANRSAFVVLQFMAARQASNSLFESIDGTEHLRVRRDSTVMTTQQAWSAALADAAVDVTGLVAESQRSAIDDYRSLLQALRRPVILLWFSTIAPPAAVGRDDSSLGALFGHFPQLVDRAMVQEIAAECAGYVECVTDENFGHALTSRFDGTPVAVDNALLGLDPLTEPGTAGGATGTDVWTTNHYYPSPEMHLDAASALEPIARSLLAGS